MVINIRHHVIEVFLAYFMIAGGLVCASGQEGTQWRPPLFSTVALLIQDEAVREELSLSKEQNQHLQCLCAQLNPLLFSLRDVASDTTDSGAIDSAARITKGLKTLSDILSPNQMRRLEGLRLQYEGVNAFFYPEVQARLRFTPSQNETIQHIYRQIQQKPSALMSSEDTLRKVKQILGVMTQSQHRQWNTMLGKPFDFSRIQPLSYRVPELRDVTAWINTPELSMQALRGKVVVVHFWTFGCSNCIQNYPVYREWGNKYDSDKVVMLGIHTPEVDYEKDISTLKKKMQEEKLQFPVAVDNNMANWQAWSNHVWPSVYLVDKNGRVRYWWYGELKWQGAKGDQWIGERIEELLREKPKSIPKEMN